jgi:protein-S-isoprenylcysteine O-methyltransferase Ste14
MSAPDTAGVLAPPPLIFATALVLGGLLDWAVPRHILPAAIAPWAGGVLVVMGLALGRAAWREMHRAGTAVSPYTDTSSLVRTGPFAHSRNPLYVALILLSLGLSLLANALWCAVLLIPAMVVLRYGVISREEVYLQRRFGDNYRLYCAATRRWL